MSAAYDPDRMGEVIGQRWAWRRDDTRREVDVFAADGTTVESSRPYTPEENAAADARAVAATQEANRRSIEDALAASLANLQTLIDTPNTTINAGPAPYIKDLARGQRRIVRLLTRRLDATS